DLINRSIESLQEMQTELNSKTVFWGVLGSILHLLMDCITQGGLYLFFPFYSQRISFGIISVFDPFLTLLSGFVVIRFLYNKFYKSYSYSLSQIEKSAKFVGILFLSLLIFYGLLQTYTITVHSPISTSPNVIPIFRWILIEDNDVISIQIVNQLTQSIIKTYKYTTLSFNRTSWNSTLIYSVVERAKSTLDYETFEFELGSETQTATSVKFHADKNNWEVRIIDTLRDAQRRYYGLPRISYMESEIKIYVDSFDQT
ncbi:MAG: metal-dependent hydrolase, partial [Promethearchaeota archaeon]